MEPPPQGLTLVHIVGTKYVDYFTDGTTTFAFAGDPAVDSHFNVPNAPTPTHEGLTWDHTTGGYLYDTPSGDLEVGDYAVQPNGLYIENDPPFVSSTSTAPTLDSLDASSTTASSTSPAVPDASTSTVPATSDTIITLTETTTPSVATTSSVISSGTTTDVSSLTPSPDSSTSTVPAPSNGSASTTSLESTTSPTL